MSLLRKKFSIVCLVLFSLSLSLTRVADAGLFDHEHSAWNLLLKKHVHWNLDHTASQVDYDGLKRNRDSLTLYLQQLSSVTRQEFDSFSRHQQLAFLINAYNAFTVELILTEYPDVESIKELGSLFSSPWKKSFFRLLDKSENLDGVEHGLIRGSGRYQEPLIHFAVNCASIGCPALLDEAFVAEKLNRQLLDSTRNFLKDRSRNRYNVNSGTLEVSSIFNWYAEDFAKGWRGYDSLHDFFRTHADWITDYPEAAGRLIGGELRIKFLDYNWRLNSLR